MRVKMRQLERIFSSMYSYWAFVIPQGVAAIDDCVFMYKSNLTKVSIPTSGAKIGSYTFYDCSNLTNVTFEGNAPSIDANCFTDVGPSCTVYVKRESSGWGVSIPGTWNGMAIRFREDDE